MVGLENRRHAVERILEDESLTADLRDAAATSLLDWGLARAEAMVQQAEGLSREELDARLAALRRTMKRVSRQAGEAAPEAQVEQVQALLAGVDTQDLEAGIGSASTSPAPAIQTTTRTCSSFTTLR